VCLLRAMVYPELSFRHHCLTTSSRVVCVSLEDSPTTWRRIGLTLPSCGSAASRFSVEGRAPLLPEFARPSSDFGPLQSVTRGTRTKSMVPALTRFFAPSTQPNRFEPPPPGFPCPGHVASFCLPCNSPPCSRIDLPDVFQPGAFMGFSALQSLP